MKKFIAIIAIALVISCTPTTNKDNSEIYQQDEEQCSDQPKLSWCVEACKTDNYRWCNESK